MKREKCVALLLILCFIITGMSDIPMTVTAEVTTSTALQGNHVETIYGQALKGSDGKTYWENGFTALNFKSDGTYEAHKTKSFQLKELIGADAKGNSCWLYCVEYNMAFSRTGYTGGSIANNSYLMMNNQGTLAKGLNHLAKNKSIAGLDGVKSIQYILVATIYGWQPNTVMPTELAIKGLNNWDWYYGTQILIWEYQQGIRQSPTQCNGNGYNKGTALYDWIKGRPAAIAYDYVNQMMVQHKTIPSFSVEKGKDMPTYTLTWKAERQRYEVTLADINGYAFPLKLKEPLHVEKEGNQYTIWTKKTILSPTIYCMQKDITIAENQALLVWRTGGKQTMISGMQDPIEFYMRLQTEKPTITIQKTGSRTEDVGQRLFWVYKDNAAVSCLQMKTDALGYAKASLPGEGTYKIIEKNAQPYEVTYSVQTFMYPSSAFDANNNITISVHNERKTGTLRIRKESEDGIVEGIQFQIAGNGINVTGTTDASGYVLVDGNADILLPPGTYTVTEINTPKRYEKPADFFVTVKLGETVERKVFNVLKPASLKLVKESEDGCIAGIKFHISGITTMGKTVEKTVNTGADGTIMVQMEQGTYTVTEEQVSNRYLPVSSQKVVLCDSNVEVLTFQNRLKPGYLQILKKSADGKIRGMKFRVQGEGIDVTGFTNEAGNVVFGQKAYWLAGTTVESNVKRIAVVTKDATVAEVFSDLRLTRGYTIGGGSSVDWEEVIGQRPGYYRNDVITGSSRIMIYDPNGKSYAQIVFRGSLYDGSAAEGLYGVTKEDLSTAKNMLGRTMNGTYTTDIAIAAYDVDQDGTITQADIAVLQQAYDTRTDLLDSDLLTLQEGSYRVTEIEVPDSYTAWFDQTVTVVAGQTHAVEVNNYLKDTGVILVKKAEDGILAGHRFRLTGKTVTGKMIHEIVTTNVDGMVVAKLERGDYSLEEIDVPDRYYPPQLGYGFNVIDDYAVIEIENKLRPGVLNLVKKSEDNVVSHISFKIQSIETINGSFVEQIVTTGEAGMVSITLPQGTYLVTELNVAEKYIVPQSQIVAVTAAETSMVVFENVLKVPTLTIMKTAEDGVVEGCQFLVTGSCYSEIVKTDEAGQLSVKLPQGTYTITEYQCPSRYIEQPSQTLVLQNDDITTITFHNILKPSRINVIKTSEDGIVEGIPFQVTGIGEDGVTVNETAYTDSDGRVTFTLKSGEYCVQEVLFDPSYVLQEPKHVRVEAGEDNISYFHNTPKKFQVEVIKKNASLEYGFSEDGEALAGAVYGLYNEEGILLGEYVTDSDGRFTTEVFPCGKAYVQEITPPYGYFLDETKYWLSSDAENCFLEITSLSLEVTDHPVTGNICILKKKGTEEKWEYEEGAIFQVYLKAAGSYEQANAWEKDLLITEKKTSAEENNLGVSTVGGEAGTKDLPMGTYVIHQISGAEGFSLTEDMEVTLTPDQNTVVLELLNVSQVELPHTGGRGEVPFVVGGSLCMLVACSATLIDKSRKTILRIKEDKEAS